LPTSSPYGDGRGDGVVGSDYTTMDAIVMKNGLRCDVNETVFLIFIEVSNSDVKH